MELSNPIMVLKELSEARDVSVHVSSTHYTPGYPNSDQALHACQALFPAAYALRNRPQSVQLWI